MDFLSIPIYNSRKMTEGELTICWKILNFIAKKIVQIEQDLDYFSFLPLVTT